MSTNKRSMHDSSCFESLSQPVQNIVKDAILKAASERCGPEGWKSEEECLDDVEHHSRDGFIAYSHNKGGLIYQNFASLMEYWGGGYTPAHEKAAKEIERQIDYSLNLAKEQVFESNEELLKSKGFIEASSVEYHTLYKTNDPELKRLAENLSEKESEYLSDETSTVMHEFRFLYHGIDEDGLHSASISAAINTEAPYHRSSISWSPGTFCEGAKEVEITWKNVAELKRKINKAFAKVSKAIF